MTDKPDFLLYAQHGWADNSKAMARLAQSLATSRTAIITPDLGWFKTWLWIEPLINQLEHIVLDTIVTYPQTPIRIIGHSMGGLIWLELLSRHRDWWSQVESLVLIGSPIGGADLARIIDPLGIGIGIAKDLGINRRQLAESIGAVIPTLVIAGDSDHGSDGTITIETTKFSPSKFVCLPNVRHAALKNHPLVAAEIHKFWANPVITQPPPPGDFITSLIQQLHSVPGMTDGHSRDFHRAKTYITFKNGISIRTWQNPLLIHHVFVASPEGDCLYSGFVGWIHNQALYQTLGTIAKGVGSRE
ncbi:MAG: lysophospholipase [Moorea sp. SIOASIH]|uniref:alpha/beta hydrolase n=1 Tax=Moorena sp. SIOASIH TaxID=2607817 RepID=UPI0013B9A0F4|nr:alpha/beta hydrolase [Moorena sp. SIOASIH]NEO37789.1 lysophospholipase [Moorena sp. SIOASIH]